jgi:hypothetical protein
LSILDIVLYFWDPSVLGISLSLTHRDYMNHDV